MLQATCSAAFIARGSGEGVCSDGFFVVKVERAMLEAWATGDLYCLHELVLHKQWGGWSRSLLATEPRKRRPEPLNGLTAWSCTTSILWLAVGIKELSDDFSMILIWRKQVCVLDSLSELLLEQLQLLVVRFHIRHGRYTWRRLVWCGRPTFESGLPCKAATHIPTKSPNCLPGNQVL